MNSKQQVIDRLLDRGRRDILKNLKERFIEEDIREPFEDREYVEDTLNIFDLLIENNRVDRIDEIMVTLDKNALLDIIYDIFKYFGVED